MLYNLVVKRACQKLELLSEVFGSATDALCYFRQLSPYPSLSLEDKGKVMCAWDVRFGTSPQNHFAACVAKQRLSRVQLLCFYGLMQSY